MIKIIVSVIILLSIFPHFTYAAIWSIPPIPKPSQDKKEIMLFATNGQPNRTEILKHIQNYKSVHLRYTYTESFQGFSAKGNRNELERLSHSYQRISSNYENILYKTDYTKSTSIPFIGAEKMRGFIDSKGNRLTGKGIKVGVIDTGIDYTHPDLKNNYKGGFDFVENDKDPMETLEKEGEPTIHGTHVAGIIAANGDMEGVAPEAELYAYRVLGPGGSGTTEQVLAAIDHAIKDKMDVINLSLGSDINGPDLPISMALNKAVEKGIVAVASNGNSGPNMWTVGTPGTSSSAISVGASTPVLKVPYLSSVQLDKPIRITPLVGSIEWKLDRSLPIIKGGYGKPEELKDCNGKVVLIMRGKIDFTTKVKNAQKVGAKAVIIYNNSKGEFQGKIEETLTIPAASISMENGKKMINQLTKQSYLLSTLYKEEVDLLATFSSRGPVTLNWLIKPDVTAPGVAINSTIPNNEYLELQGTSMAAPHIAGAAALIKQAHPSWSPKEIKSAIMNTAVPLFNKKGERYRTYEQGTGRIDVEKAVLTESLVMPGSLSFGILTEKNQARQEEVIIKNVSNRVKHYHFSIPKNPFNLDWKLPLAFSVNPGEEKKLIIQASIKRPFMDQKEIIDGSLLLIEASNSIEIPYLFIQKKPSYPRIMGFSIVPGDKPDTIRYEVYLPTGAEEFGIALFEPDTMKFLGFLETKRNTGAGLKENQIQLPELKHLKQVVAVAFAREDGKEDVQSQVMPISEYD